MGQYRLAGPSDAWEQAVEVDNGCLNLQAGCGAGPTHGATAGHASEWDPFVLLRRVKAVWQALVIGRERAEAAIVAATGLEELARLAKTVLWGMLQLVAIVAASTALGAAAGAALGALAFGAGAAPGAVAGGELGFHAAMAVMAWLGLGMLVVEIGRGLGEVTAMAEFAVTTAWNAEGSPQRSQQIDLAGQVFADAIGKLMLLLILAIVAILTKRQAVASSGKAAASGAELFEALRKSRLGAEFAAWVEANADKLMRNPKFRLHNERAGSDAVGSQAQSPSQIRRGSGGGKPQAAVEEPSPRQQRAQSSANRAPKPLPRNRAELKERYGEALRNSSTFKPQGLSRDAADRYLETAQGETLLKNLRAAAPDADASTIYARAVGQLSTGAGEPVMLTADQPLIKIVPRGSTPTAHSPFFTTPEALEAAQASGKGLADAFGLPLASEAPVYDIFEIRPLQSTQVFVSEVAPTTELGGLAQQSGGATQVLVPNRSAWSLPQLIGSVAN